jgi:hypothetical protein
VNNPTEQRHWRDASKPHGWTSDGDTWIDPRGVRYGFQQRRAARRTRGDRRSRAIVIIRFQRNHRPQTVAGACVRAVLKDLHWASYDYVADEVSRWTDDPVEFIHEAVNDKGAQVSILIRLDDR